MKEVRRTPNGASALAAIWRYIFRVNERFEPAELLPLLVAAVGVDEREEIVNVAEKLIEQGREQGAREVLVRLLLSRFGALPEHVLARVNAADTAAIDRWAERLLTASSLEAVLGDG